jgi:hypothetical protein
MTGTEEDGHRATGIWPTRPMTPFEPLPAPRPPRRSRILKIVLGLIAALVLFVAAGAAYMLAAGQT